MQRSHLLALLVEDFLPQYPPKVWGFVAAFEEVAEDLRVAFPYLHTHLLVLVFRMPFPYPLIMEIIFHIIHKTRYQPHQSMTDTQEFYLAH